MESDEGRKGEFRLFGPPGTGKTTWMSKQISVAAQKFGASNVLVASFTKAAAKELVGRELPIPEEAIGTLHAHCYRALGRPKIAEAFLKEFGEAAGMLFTGPGIAPGMEDGIERPAGTTADDDDYLEHSRLRNMLVPREAWPERIKNFDRQWTGWKKEHDMVDFTDLIETATAEMLYAPGNAQVGFFDECQDSTPLQHKLMRSWGKNMRFFILAGDDDQCLYHFLGAKHSTLVGGEFPEDRKLFLRQSWRVPRAVQAFAQRVIEKVAARQVKEYQPRDEEGCVVINNGVGFKRPQRLLDDIEDDLARGETVMVLAPCSYALQPMVRQLKAEAIAFANPFRVTRGDWNPLALSKKKESALSRVRDYLQPNLELRIEDKASKIWDAKQIRAWTKLVDHKNIFARGFKAALDRMAEEEHDASQILDLLWQFSINPEFVSKIITALSKEQVTLAIDILKANFKPDSKISVENAHYALACMEKAGGKVEDVIPKVCVGTIHSVKGGQADNVYIIPDVPQNVYLETLHSRDSYDASIRLAYVALTRAKKKVSILRPETRFTLRGMYS